MKSFRRGLLLISVQAAALDSNTGRDRERLPRGFPGIEAAGQVGYVPVTGPTQQACRDRTPVATFAVDDQEFRAVQLSKPCFQLSKGNCQ